MWFHRPRASSFFFILSFVWLFFAIFLRVSESSQAATGAIRANAGFAANALPATDDGSSPLTALGFTIDFFGVSFNSVYVNNNGNVTFDQPQTAFTPFSLLSTGRQIIAPFFADVDTAGPGSGVATYGQDTVAGRPAFGVNWINVGYYNDRTDKLNSFQLVIIDRSDINPGDFDFEFNYESIQWESGQASGGPNGLGGDTARAGYSNGGSAAFELPGSAVDGALLDSNLSTGLTHNSLDAGGQLGRYVFSVRNGAILTPSPTPTPDPGTTATPVGTAFDATCDWTSAQTGNAFLVNAPAGAVPQGTVRCHALNRDGIYLENPGQIGVQSLIDMGVMQAVDVYGMLEGGISVVPFSQPVTTCLRGDGRMYLLSAASLPRLPIAVDWFAQGEYRCTQLSNSGTVVMVRP